MSEIDAGTMRELSADAEADEDLSCAQRYRTYQCSGNHLSCYPVVDTVGVFFLNSYLWLGTISDVDRL